MTNVKGIPKTKCQMEHSNGRPVGLDFGCSDFTTRSGEKRWYAGHAFAVDHFRNISGDAFHDPVEERLALLCGGKGGLVIGLIGPDCSADVVRERGQRDGGFKLLRVTRQVFGEAVAAVQKFFGVGFRHEVPIRQELQIDLV